MDSNISSNRDPFIDRSTTGTSVGTDYSERESWKHMVNRFYTDVTHLFEKEGELIRAELNEKASDIKTASASLISGGVVLFVGVLSLAATLTILLNLVTSLWVASLIVTVAFLLIGAGMLGAAKKKLEADKLKPRKSIEAFGEIRHSLKEKVNEITKH
ncbi:MAG: phage holin family protein [Bacteriovoracia bacterium]